MCLFAAKLGGNVVAALLKEFSNCGLEFESTRNLDHAVQATAADGVRRSDLTKRRTVDVEDGVAGPTKPQTRSKNSR